jgi:hypothetical protein
MLDFGVGVFLGVSLVGVSLGVSLVGVSLDVSGAGLVSSTMESDEAVVELDLEASTALSPVPGPGEVDELLESFAIRRLRIWSRQSGFHSGRHTCSIISLSGASGGAESSAMMSRRLHAARFVVGTTCREHHDVVGRTYVVGVMTNHRHQSSTYSHRHTSSTYTKHERHTRISSDYGTLRQSPPELDIVHRHDRRSIPAQGQVHIS